MASQEVIYWNFANEVESGRKSISLALVPIAKVVVIILTDFIVSPEAKAKGISDLKSKFPVPELS